MVAGTTYFAALNFLGAAARESQETVVPTVRTCHRRLWKKILKLWAQIKFHNIKVSYHLHVQCQIDHMIRGPRYQRCYLTCELEIRAEMICVGAEDLPFQNLYLPGAFLEVSLLSNLRILSACDRGQVQGV